MQQLFNLSIRTKINIIAILGALGFVIYLSISYFQGSQTQSQLNKLEHRQLPVLEGINNASLDMLQLKTFLSVAISSSESSMVDNAELHHQNILTVLNKIKSLHGKFAQRATDLLNKRNEVRNDPASFRPGVYLSNRCRFPISSRRAFFHARLAAITHQARLAAITHQARLAPRASARAWFMIARMRMIALSRPT